MDEPPHEGYGLRREETRQSVRGRRETREVWGAGALLRMELPGGSAMCGEGEESRQVTAVLNTTVPMTLTRAVSLAWGEG